MRNLRLTLAVLLLLPFTAIAQTTSGILDTLGLIIPSSVSIGSDVYEQEIKAKDDDPCTIHFRSIKSDSRGRMNVEDFYFSAMDLSVEEIMVEEGRKSTSVKVVMLSKEPLVKYFRDQIPQPYVRSINILASNPTNADQILYQIKKLQAPCQEDFDAANDFSNASLDELLNWMVDNTKDVLNLEGNVSQSLGREALQTGEGLVFTSSQNNSKGEAVSVSRSFNAGDLDGAEARLNVRGKEVLVVVPTRARQRYIYAEGPGAATGFEQQLQIEVASVEEAKSWLRVLELMTPMAKTVFDEQLKLLGSEENALSKLQAMKMTSKSAAGSTRTQLNGDCFSSWKVSTKPAKGEEEQITYKVFLQDVEKSEIRINANSVEVMLEAIDRNKYIEVVQGGARQSFESRFGIPVEDIEQAQIVNYLLQKALEGCRSVPPKSAGDRPEELMEYLIGLSGKVNTGREEIIQNFRAIEDGASCELRIVHKRETGRRAGDMVYEITASDIDPESVRLYVFGKTLAVDFDTRNNATLITAINNGEPEGFENTLRVWAKNLEEARELAYAIQSLAVSCGE